ncbi:hypothetical protein [Pedobacter nyackensis]|uniref:Uncharacterized protein n=1 Tax=Pedobacter nyackensis TaxID=475255 RepID=A0A1W2EZR8_9SPHI|nr:hypothetical protein [Pedobacter nyackensis]SMD15072.1 hypothetical protein SAMN04488101_11810 [Pedobacter nyackensis]
MKTTFLSKSAVFVVIKYATDFIFFGLLLLVWFTAPKIMQFENSTAGYIDPAIWLLVLLAFISFLMILPLCWWLLQRSWRALGLPGLGLMVSQFKFLKIWQQLGFYFACFALLLLVAVGCLAAVM